MLSFKPTFSLSIAIVNGATVNIGGYRFLFQFWVPQGICLKVVLLGLYGSFIPDFLRNLHTVFHHGSVNSVFPIAVHEGFLFSTSSPALVCGLFDDGNSDWYEVIAHCSFYLHFSNN